MYTLATGNLSTGMSTAAWIGIAVGSLVLIVLVILLVNYLIARLGAERPPRRPGEPGPGRS
jgi:flagellar biogenesis protein FliO